MITKSGAYCQSNTEFKCYIYFFELKKLTCLSLSGNLKIVPLKWPTLKTDSPTKAMNGAS